jgi:hypothetical protein
MPPGVSEFFKHLALRAWLQLWSWSGLGWPTVILSILLFGRKVRKTFKETYHRYYSKFQLWGICRVAMESTKKSFDWDETKLVAKWGFLVFLVAAGQVVWSDHIESERKYNSLLRENNDLAEKLKSKPEVVTQMVPQPPDSSLMKLGDYLGMESDIRTTLRTHAHIAFIITAPPENAGVKQELEGLLQDSCPRAVPPIDCFVEPISSSDQPNGLTPSPRKGQQGLTIQVFDRDLAEAPGPNRNLIIDDISSILVKRLIVHNNPEPLPHVLTEEPRFQKRDIVFIQIGYGVPWKEKDVRLRHDGVSRVVIDGLNGWDLPLPRRLSDAAAKISNIIVRGGRGPGPRRGPAGMKNAYQQVSYEVLVVFRHAHAKGLDVGDMETLAIDPKEEKDFAAIRDALIKLSADPLLDAVR